MSQEKETTRHLWTLLLFSYKIKVLSLLIDSVEIKVVDWLQFPGWAFNSWSRLWAKGNPSHNWWKCVVNICWRVSDSWVNTVTGFPSCMASELRGVSCFWQLPLKQKGWRGAEVDLFYHEEVGQSLQFRFLFTVIVVTTFILSLMMTRLIWTLIPILMQRHQTCALPIAPFFKHRSTGQKFKMCWQVKLIALDWQPHICLGAAQK